MSGKALLAILWLGFVRGPFVLARSLLNGGFVDSAIESMSSGLPQNLRVGVLNLGEGSSLLIFEWATPEGDVAGVLTEAEKDVLRLLLSGLSNAEAGLRRGTSERTIAKQVASLFEKLGVQSREGLFSLVAGGSGGSLSRSGR